MTALTIMGPCPACGASWRDGAFSRLIALEYPDRYDGVWEWRCPDCGATFPREAVRLEEP